MIIHPIHNKDEELNLEYYGIVFSLPGKVFAMVPLYWIRDQTVSKVNLRRDSDQAERQWIPYS